MPLHKCAAGKKLSKLFNSNLPHFDFPSLKPVVSFKRLISLMKIFSWLLGVFEPSK